MNLRESTEAGCCDTNVTGGGLLDSKNRVKQQAAQSGDADPVNNACVRPALVHKAKVGKTVARRTRNHIRTAYEAGIPSSVIRLRMLHASRASTDCPSASRACSRSPRINL